VTAPRRPVQLEVFSDVSCPWCYIGKAKLEPALEEFRADGGRVEVRFRPFLLQPDFHGPSRPLMDYLTERFGSQADQLSGGATAAGAQVGLTMDMKRAIAADTRLAHQLVESAYRDGGFEAQQAVTDQLFRSHFSLGEDVADPAILRSAGQRAGLDPETVERALDDPALAAAVQASLVEASELGMRAVPTFVADRSLGVQGAQPTATLLALLEKAAGAGLE
jgi:predicted DsbA family dithiol-disulfide isomerase